MNSSEFREQLLLEFYRKYKHVSYTHVSCLQEISETDPEMFWNFPEQSLLFLSFFQFIFSIHSIRTAQEPGRGFMQEVRRSEEEEVPHVVAQLSLVRRGVSNFAFSKRTRHLNADERSDVRAVLESGRIDEEVSACDLFL